MSDELALHGGPKAKQTPYTLTNRYGEQEIEDIHFVIGLAMVCPIAIAVNTLGERLSLNLMYVEPLMSSARARRLAAAAMQRLSIARDA